MEQSSTCVSPPIAVVADGSPAAAHGDEPPADWRDWRSSPTMRGGTVPAADRRVPWTLLSNHGLALLVLAAEPSCRISEVARVLGITERATIRMINDLVRAGYVVRTRIGRRNAYAVNRDARLRHTAMRWQSVTALLRLLDPPDERAEAPEAVIRLGSARDREEVVAGIG
jgi:MarR family